MVNTGPLPGLRVWHRPRRAHLALVVAVVILAEACSSGSASRPATPLTSGTTRLPTTLAPATTVPAGFSVFTDPDYHFTIAVPNSWRKVDLSPGAIQALQMEQQGNFQLKTAVGNPAERSLRGTKFFAIDLSAAIEHYAWVNVDVLRDNSGEGLALAQSADIAVSVLKESGNTVTGPTPIRLAGHQGLQVKGTTSLGGSMATHTIDLVYALGFLYFIHYNYVGDNPAISTIESTFSVS